MKNTFADAMLDSGILDAAAAVLGARAATGDESILGILGEIHRKRGDLVSAASTYARLRALAPDDRVTRWNAAILEGEPLPVPPGSSRIAPFVAVPNLLPDELHAHLLARVLDSTAEQFVPSKVGLGEYRPELRSSLCVEGTDDLLEEFIAHVAVYFADLPTRLAVDPFRIALIERRVRAYREGHFFEVHRDNTLPEMESRTVSFVYFFHPTPRRFSGGDLLLFDTDVEAHTRSMTTFTRIVPHDNLLVFFPSEYFHAVVPVRCASDELADSRFVINGHIRRRMASETAADARA